MTCRQYVPRRLTSAVLLLDLVWCKLRSRSRAEFAHTALGRVCLSMVIVGSIKTIKTQGRAKPWQRAEMSRLTGCAERVHRLARSHHARALEQARASRGRRGPSGVAFDEPPASAIPAAATPRIGAAREVFDARVARLRARASSFYARERRRVPRRPTSSIMGTTR